MTMWDMRERLLLHGRILWRDGAMGLSWSFSGCSFCFEGDALTIACAPYPTEEYLAVIVDGVTYKMQVCDRFSLALKNGSHTVSLRRASAGAICHAALQEKGVFIGTHLSRCAGVEDRAFGDLKADIKRLSEKPFPALSEEAGDSMQKAIAAAGAEGDSVGGVLETAVIGLPAGVGEPWFDTVEGVLAHMLFSVPAVKGVEFGDGFALADKRGSAANDAMYYENGIVTAATNHGGGIGGGITSGMPLIFRCAVKPTPSIAKEQKTVDIAKKENTVLAVKGRHDPAVVHRARAVVDAATAIALCDLLTVRFGTDFLAKKGEV